MEPTALSDKKTVFINIDLSLVYISINPSSDLSIHYICPSIYLSIYVYVRLSLTIFLYIYLSIYLSINLCVHLSVCLSIYVYVHAYIYVDVCTHIIDTWVNPMVPAALSNE